MTEAEKQLFADQTGMSISDIDAHLSNFDNGGSYLVRDDAFEAYTEGKATLGYPDNSNYILSSDELVVCFVPNLVMKIKVKGALPAINIGSQKSLLARIGGQTGEYSGFVEVLPWEDTIMAMNELGTMIDDLQKQGDYAIEKWSK